MFLSRCLFLCLSLSLSLCLSRWLGGVFETSVPVNFRVRGLGLQDLKFFINILIWHWRWQWALLQRILAREWQSYETRDTQMYIFLPNVDLALTLAMWERQRESLCENENPMSSFNQQTWCFIKNVNFSLDKCRFDRGVLHYVLRRKRVIFWKHDNCGLEICVKARGGRLALQNGRPLSLIC